MELIVDTDKRLTFPKAGVKEIAEQVLPEKLKENEKLKITINDRNLSSTNKYPSVAEIGTSKENKHDYLITLNLGEILQKNPEEPIQLERPEVAVKLGYNPDLEAENEFHYLSQILAHEFKHIEQHERYEDYTELEKKHKREELEKEAEEYGLMKAREGLASKEQSSLFGSREKEKAK